MNSKEVDIFIPCFIDQAFPQTAFNMMKVLKKVGVNVHYNPEQTCCGQTAFKHGHWDKAKKLGEKFITDFNNNRYIVTPATSCPGYVKTGFDELFYNGGYHNEYKQIQKNIYEITDFLVNVLGVTDLGAVFDHKVTFHDSCTSLREYQLGNEPRMLLEKVRGLQLVEMKESKECCGFGGTFAVYFEPVSIAMTEQKVLNAVNSGAEYIVSTDMTCLMHQEAYIKKNKIPLKVIHIIDVLASF